MKANDHFVNTTSQENVPKGMLLKHGDWYVWFALTRQSFIREFVDITVVVPRGWFSQASIKRNSSHYYFMSRKMILP